MNQSTTIQMLKDMPAGSRTGGFEFAIKTRKKCMQIGDEWIHTVVLMDKTGDMIADVVVGKRYNPITAPTIRIIVSDVQDSELMNKPIKKLFVHEFSVPSCGSEPEPTIARNDNQTPDWTAIAEGKVRCALVCAFIQSPTIQKIDKELIRELVEFIMKGN